MIQLILRTNIIKSQDISSSDIYNLFRSMANSFAKLGNLIRLGTEHKRAEHEET